MEIWKDIPEYKGLYQVSNYGNIRSLDTIINCKGAKNIDNHKRNGRLLKKQIGTTGYYCVNLSKNSKVKNVRIHRLVAIAFIPNPNNYYCINHKDGNKLNNNVDNLEWCAFSTNNKEAYRIGLKRNKYAGKYGKEAQFSKPVIQLSLDDEFIREWDNASEVKRKLGFCAENIRSVCCGRRKQANGYKWKYKEVKE